MTKTGSVLWNDGGQGRSLNRKRQPFQTVAIPHFQQIAGRGRLRKSFQVLACLPYCGLHYGLQIGR
jgi:hypothetical protein